jgi:hypothetical protein
MRVSSPIGDLPFEPRRIHVSRGGVEIDGAMGAWPAHVHVDAGDLPALARLLPLRTITFLTVAGLIAHRVRRSRTPHTPRRTRNV